MCKMLSIVVCPLIKRAKEKELKNMNIGHTVD